MKHVQKVFSNDDQDDTLRIEIKNLSIDFSLAKIDLDTKKEWLKHIPIQWAYYLTS